MKKSLFYFLLLLPLAIGFTACNNDDDDEQGASTWVVINDDGTTSNGSTFSVIDSLNFYLDYIKYTIEEGHLIVTGYDKKGFSGVANIVPSISYKGNFYEVLEIGEFAFYKCTSLTSVNISRSVTTIGGNAFSHCTSLTSVNIPNSVTLISGAVFNGCTGLTSVSIPNSVTNIGPYAFYLCSGLTSVTLPSSLKYIQKWSFSGCTGLKAVHCLNTTPPHIVYIQYPPYPPFDDTTYKTVTLYVPKGALKAYQSDDIWGRFKTIVEE